MLSPDGGALDSLNALLTDAPDQDANNPRSVVSRVSDGVYRLDDAFVAALADRDQDEVTDLVAPWQEQVLDPGDLEDFLINLQHVARHARANGHQVYGLDD